MWVGIHQLIIWVGFQPDMPEAPQSLPRQSCRLGKQNRLDSELNTWLIREWTWNGIIWTNADYSGSVVLSLPTSCAPKSLPAKPRQLQCPSVTAQPPGQLSECNPCTVMALDSKTRLSSHASVMFMWRFPMYYVLCELVSYAVLMGCWWGAGWRCKANGQQPAATHF